MIHSSGILSRQGTVTTAYRWDSSVWKRSVSYDWLTHTSIWLLNRLIRAVSSSLVLFPSPMGTGDNLSFIEIQLQWVQGGWRSFFYCHRWDGVRARHQTLKVPSLSDSTIFWLFSSLPIGELSKSHRSILWHIQTRLTTGFNKILLAGIWLPPLNTGWQRCMASFVKLGRNYQWHKWICTNLIFRK